MTQNLDINPLVAGRNDELSVTTKSREQAEFERQQEAEANKHKLEQEAADKAFQRRKEWLNFLVSVRVKTLRHSAAMYCSLPGLVYSTKPQPLGGGR